MSHLKLFAPDTYETDDCMGTAEEPVVLSFYMSFDQESTTSLPSRFGSRFSAPEIHVIRRAKTLARNRCCPSCQHPIVEPLDLGNGIRGRNGNPIPGTSSLVGFRCDRCTLEWPA